MRKTILICSSLLLAIMITVCSLLWGKEDVDTQGGGAFIGDFNWASRDESLVPYLEYVIKVKVKDEYEAKFSAKEFTIDEFGTNVARIGYLTWRKTRYSDYGEMHLYLKQGSDYLTKKTLKYIRSLDFVKDAELIWMDFTYEHVKVHIKKEYKDAYLEEQFKLEDFECDNIDSIEYIGWMDFYEEGAITVYLKEPGERQVLKIMEQLSDLDFVAEVSKCSTEL